MQSTDTTPWYNKYTGFPYRHLGDSPKSGIDCVNLCRYVYEKERSIKIGLSSMDFCNIVEEDWYSRTTERLFENGIKVKTADFSWIQVKEPETFDIILLSIGATNVTNHCALYVGDNKILHTAINKCSWLAPYGNYYKQYTTGIYRWKPLNS